MTPSIDYVYNGDRVLKEIDDNNGSLARYTTASSSYYQPLLHFKRNDGSIRYPLADIVGTARQLVDQNGAATDAYSLDAFGRYVDGWANPTPNPYRFGAAWGYITDTPGSGLLQLGARTYWPEIGRFIQQDPAKDGINWYTYADNNPLTGIDPEGLKLVLVGDKLSISHALRYLRKDRKMRKIINDLKKSHTNYKIITIDNDDDRYDPATRKVYWDPHSALLTTGGGRQSPALGLGHELGHADISPARQRELSITPCPEYENMEERRVITEIETPVARHLGEGTRADHFGRTYRVRTPMSRWP